MAQAMNAQNKQGGLSGSTLKWIAMVTMIIDHMGAAILLPLLNSGQLETFDYSLAYTAYTSFRLIGRIAFPIFCFLLVEGFFYTSNKQKYAIRLGIFALISEIPFNLAISQQFFDLA
ncbi:MAG: TraX family protein, partial [Aerococcus urinaeequi]